MDAADRAELDRLRRRVFGPEGDVSPATLQRLEALEAEFHAEAPPAPPHEPPHEEGTPLGVRAVPEPPPPRPRDRGIRPAAPTPLRTAVTLGALVVALFLGFRLLAELPRPAPAMRTETVTAREAYTLVRDRDAQIIERIPSTVPTSAPDAPWFATSGVVTRAAHLGTLYGWEVWTAVAQGAIQSEACLSLRREPVIRGRCVPAVLRDTSALVVDIPYDAMPDDLRPDGMTDRQRLGFWWASDSGVYVVLASAPEAAPR
jgi:hypothetical protein